MENHFICPNCHGHLKVGNHIIFRIRNRKKDYGLLLLDPKIGNYQSIKHPEFEFQQGEALEFYCPLCHQNLGADFDQNLTHVEMIDKDNKEHDIYFSRIAGEESTYQVSGDTVRASGEHSGKYTYFKMSAKFKNFLKS